jgi:membrane protease YdiL (CAAX protease family)
MNIYRWLRQHPIAVYLLSANVITWLGWLPSLIISSQQGYPLPVITNYRQLLQTGFPNPQRSLLTLAFNLAVYGPLLAAIIATALETGKAGLAELWRQIVRWRVDGRWYLTIVGIAVVLVGLPIGLGASVGLMRLNTVGLLDFLPTLIPVFIIQVLTSGLGEEPGWRGFLLPRLQTRFSGGKPIWIMGLIWAVWHYPLTIYYTLPQLAGAPSFVRVLMVISALGGQTMTLLGIAFLYAWLYNHTRSLFVAILFHALTNTLTAIPFGEMLPIITLFIAIMPWVVVVAARKMLPKGEFPGSPTDVSNKGADAYR